MLEADSNINTRFRNTLQTKGSFDAIMELFLNYKQESYNYQRGS